MGPMLTPPDATADHHMLVVDDHDLVRLGLRTLLQSHAADRGRNVQVLEARTLLEALGLYRNHRNDIHLVLLDLNLPDTHGLSGLAVFLAQFPDAPVVVLSGINDPSLVRQALAQGARAYLAKSGDLQHVVAYIRSLGLLGPQASPVDLSDLPATPAMLPTLATPPQRPQLTERQAQVLEWILAGHSNREIAQQAHLSEGTVKNHVSALLLLFGTRSRAQLISRLR